MKRIAWTILPVLLVFAFAFATAASAPVASLRTPEPVPEASEAPTEGIDSQDAILGFSACMREHGIDLPDPRFGFGSFFARGAMDGIDLLDPTFLDAFAACQDFLMAAVPAVDPEQQAERLERGVAFAACMRAAGIDWPDPDPVSGMSFSSMRAEDGSLLFDPFDPDFQAASRACAAETGASVPGMPSGGTP
jgi:hypothetical protein